MLKNWHIGPYLVVDCRLNHTWNKYFSPEASRGISLPTLLVGAYSSQPVFHCDLHSFQENSQPVRQPPTYSLTLTSHLHFIIPPAPPHIQSHRKLSPQTTFRDTKRIHEGQHTIACNTVTAGKHPLTRVQWTNKQTNKHPLTRTRPKVFQRKPLFWHCNVLYCSHPK